jgi:carbamoyl-phosphate synthase large subunit
MPKRTDIKKILIIGSGPIVIGQACEFDYSGVQALKVLRAEGFELVLVNNNPATIMTDPEFADHTYIEPLTPDFVERVIAKEKPDSLLPTLGGQTALNLALKLAKDGTLKKHGVRMLGVSPEAIEMAEDRLLFKQAMDEIGLKSAESVYVKSIEEGLEAAKQINYPVIIRPSFTLGGSGGAVAPDEAALKALLRRALDESPVHQVLLERSLLGWKEFELEVIRDHKDNCVIVCSIENVDAMGVHTGDSITVAPAQTLTDPLYQKLRDASFAILRKIGVDTGGSNVQFSVDPKTDEIVIIEMNPRVSRSSALASKATGYPIAKVAALLAVGYTLDEITNDITLKTKAAFEPALDYIVVKAPRFTFEKFQGADDFLTTQMKSVGEAMAIGRTFPEALQKALRSLETGRDGIGYDGKDRWRFPLLGEAAREATLREIRERLEKPHSNRIFTLRAAIEAGMSTAEIYRHSAVDPWFLEGIREIVNGRWALLDEARTGTLSAETIRNAKRLGFSDAQIGWILDLDADEVREYRKSLGILPVFRRVDTCAGEFEAHTPYLYSTYEESDESRPTKKKKIIILGAGPNRIGQGLEFDYCSVQACYAFKEEGFETIMVNCNPETVSTDYDTADRLYFEPLTLESVLDIIDNEKPFGVVLQFGGQTPLKLAKALHDRNVPILGTPFESIHAAEDRDEFKALMTRLKINYPISKPAVSLKELPRVARELGFPVMIRPSYVLGGRAMEIFYSDLQLDEAIPRLKGTIADGPLMVDSFLEDALEVDVDGICDGKSVYIGALMEHIEEAGVHSGDSISVLPPFSLASDMAKEIEKDSAAIAKALEVKGHFNIQFAVKGDTVYCLEVNPRASRSVPFVGKSTGVPLAKLATRILAGHMLKEYTLRDYQHLPYFTVKMPVFPFKKFPEVDALLGPEMKSTGEGMGSSRDFPQALAKALLSSRASLPTGGQAFVSVKNKDKRQMLLIARKLVDLGFKLVATEGTAQALKKGGLAVRRISKVSEGSPNIVDMAQRGEISLIINTPSGGPARRDSAAIRRAAVTHSILYFTTMAGAQFSVQAIEAWKEGKFEVESLKRLYELPEEERE